MKNERKKRLKKSAKQPRMCLKATLRYPLDNLLSVTFLQAYHPFVLCSLFSSMPLPPSRCIYTLQTINPTICITSEEQGHQLSSMSL